MMPPFMCELEDGKWEERVRNCRFCKTRIHVVLGPGNRRGEACPLCLKVTWNEDDLDPEEA